MMNEIRRLSARVAALEAENARLTGAMARLSEDVATQLDALKVDIADNYARKRGPKPKTEASYGQAQTPY